MSSASWSTLPALRASYLYRHVERPMTCSWLWAVAVALWLLICTELSVGRKFNGYRRYLLSDHPFRSEGGGQSNPIPRLRGNDQRNVLFRNSNASAEKTYVCSLSTFDNCVLTLHSGDGWSSETATRRDKRILSPGSHSYMRSSRKQRRR